MAHLALQSGHCGLNALEWSCVGHAVAENPAHEVMEEKYQRFGE